MGKHRSSERSGVKKISITMTNDTRSASLAWSLRKLQFSQEAVPYLAPRYVLGKQQVGPERLRKS
jgi:hypothetical protein